MLKDAYENIPDVNFDNIHTIEFELDKLLEEEEMYCGDNNPMIIG